MDITSIISQIKNTSLFLFLLILIYFGTPGCITEKVSLNVKLYPQESETWCWAASGQMIMEFLDNLPHPQCQQANDLFCKNNCCNQNLCNNPTGTGSYIPGQSCQACSSCICSGWPDFQKYNFSFSKTTSTPLSWDQVKNQIGNLPAGKNKPFAFTWAWTGGGSHMMVAKGYSSGPGSNYIEVYDPKSTFSCQGEYCIINYAYYKVSPGHHDHSDDFYDITYKGGN